MMFYKWKKKESTKNADVKIEYESLGRRGSIKNEDVKRNCEFERIRYGQFHHITEIMRSYIS